jgi:hypothetical protein
MFEKYTGKAVYFIYNRQITHAGWPKVKDSEFLLGAE